ncbi:MAG: hypothetical protein IPP38_03530 [Bacteroidetes bacterium]|nr:hypothetical protein [Bacteroidota bacterium]
MFSFRSLFENKTEMLKVPVVLLFIFYLGGLQTISGAVPDSTVTKQVQDYQISLPRPAKEIKRILYDKSFLPVQGKLSEDKKSVIIKNYEKGSRVRIKVVYEDDTEEEILKSPCYIDPVVL